MGVMGKRGWTRLVRQALSHLRGNVVAYLALFVALSATAYAATAPRNSVVSKSIRNGQVKAQDHGASSVGADAVDERKMAANVFTALQTCDDGQSFGQDIPSGADTRVRYTAGGGDASGASDLLDFEDDCDAADTGVITVNAEGNYLIVAGARWEENAVGTRFLGIQKVGPVFTSTLAGDRRAAVGSGLATEQTVSGIENLQPGDKIQTIAFQDSGTDLTLSISTSTERRTFIEVVYLGTAFP